MCDLDEAPWASIRRGEPIDPRGLAHRLIKYGIGSKTHRQGDTVFRGYSRGQFSDAWSRYLPPTAAPVGPDGNPLSVTADTPAPESVTDVTDVTHQSPPTGQCRDCGQPLSASPESRPGAALRRVPSGINRTYSGDRMTTNSIPNQPPALDARTGAPIPIDRTAYHVILGDGGSGASIATTLCAWPASCSTTWTPSTRARCVNERHTDRPTGRAKTAPRPSMVRPAPARAICSMTARPRKPSTHGGIAHRLRRYLPPLSRFWPTAASGWNRWRQNAARRVSSPECT